MRLTREPAWPLVVEHTARILDRRLTLDDPAPVAVALSGGGDSLALLLAAVAWARRRGRRLVAITVDHGLNPRSPEWTAWCARRCAVLGVAHLARRWDGPRPATGLAAAARLARHRLLAEAAREAGARVVLMGHTADDRMEADVMRQAGATTPSPREWAPSPAWPQGRDVFLLRPLLDLRRATLRAGLAEQGEDWIEDPANADPASARARARLVIAGEGVASHASPGPDAGPLPFRCGPAGELSAAPGALLDAPAPTFRLWIGTALACAAGDARAPRAVALDRLRARLDAGRPFGATLAGARMVFDGAVVVIAREAADPRADAPASIDLAPGEPTVWDGRFEATARTPGLRMASLRGRMARLASADRRLLRRVHPAARPALPVALNALGQIACPTLAAGAEPAVRPLIMARLAGACGAIHHERAMVAWRMDGDHPKFAA